MGNHGTSAKFGIDCSISWRRWLQVLFMLNIKSGYKFNMSPSHNSFFFLRHIFAVPLCSHPAY